MPATILVNTKIAQGPRYGAFFLMPEDNLANLVMGNEEAIGPDGTEQDGRRGPRDLVMIYPKEGAVLNSNPAAVVDASWVSDEESGSGGRAGSSTCSRTTSSAPSWTWDSGPPKART